MATDWGSLAGAAVSLGSAYFGSKGAKDAGKDASKAANAANDITWRMYQDTMARQQPFYNSGVAALDKYNQLMGLGGASGGNPAQNQMSQYVQFSDRGIPIANAQLYASDPKYREAWDKTLAQHQQQWRVGYHKDSDVNMIQGQIASMLPQQAQPAAQTPQQQQQAAFDSFRATPGYQFSLDEGNRSVQASAAARGGLNSGATLKALTRFGQGYADQQGYTPYMNRLAALSGVAQTSASQMGNYGQNAASQIGGNLQNAATARANSTYASNQAWQQGLGNAAGFFGDWYGNRGGG